MAIWEVMAGGGAVTGEDVSGARSFLEWDPSPPQHHSALLSSCVEDGWREAGLGQSTQK